MATFLTWHPVPVNLSLRVCGGGNRAFVFWHWSITIIQAIVGAGCQLLKWVATSKTKKTGAAAVAKPTTTGASHCRRAVHCSRLLC